LPVTVTVNPLLRNRDRLHPVEVSSSMPYLRYRLASSLETSAFLQWSTRSRNSTMVTLNAVAAQHIGDSTPIAPARR